MPFISPDDGHLTVFNLFETETPAGQEQVLDAMRDIIDNATYPGWISSTLHAGQDRPGTANYIQWTGLEALEARYAGEGFKRKTVPKFNELATSVRLLKTEAEFVQRHPGLDGAPELSPARDDYTVIIVLGVAAENQKELLDTLATPEEWLAEVPGYRSHTYFRGLDGTFLVNYAQWDGKEAYDAFHALPEEQRPRDVRDARARARSLVTSRWANTYHVVHSRSAQG
ncbi:antibiotic biosynthesis monooxygenase family protein [Streptomyces sp. RerS4]|uniref:antibiotic biosynthesis monooxygenase family protein n=1 Tax=Streptomyces sp. RerS4 TaxID=2942449 RepID=UPI00201C4ECD|nr:antibiotic biosynthesis monooxygenase family protein [Streptomyces sp. RerS4]UQX03449.1 antibiotic biosynthesis monooxygenase [Streptomyces sp. RerS4]